MPRVPSFGLWERLISFRGLSCSTVMRLTNTLSLAPFNGAQTGIYLRSNGTTTPSYLCANVRLPTSAFQRMTRAAPMWIEESSTQIGTVSVPSAWTKTIQITFLSNLKEILAPWFPKRSSSKSRCATLWQNKVLHVKVRKRSKNMRRISP